MRLIEKAFNLAKEQLKKDWKEISGEKSNPNIMSVYTAVDGLEKMKLNDDLVPWCAAFVNKMIQDCGGKGTRSAMARSFLDWGIPSDGKIGDIVIIKRGDSQIFGHVGFVYNIDKDYVYILGGNQSNDVNVSKYSKLKVLRYRTSNDLAIEQITNEIKNEIKHEEKKEMQVMEVKLKETKEALVGVLAIAKIIVELSKDGIQVSDAISLFNKLQDEEIKGKIDAAISDIKKVQEEIQVCGLSESVDLIVHVLPEVKELIEALYKKA